MSNNIPPFIPWNGLMIPQGYVESLYKAQHEIERQKRGQFFSEYAHYGIADRKGIPAKPSNTPSFPFLRMCAKESVIDRALIDARITQIKRVARPCWVPGKQVGYRVVHYRYADPTFEMTEGVRQRQMDMMRRLEKVTPEVHGNIRNFLAQCVEEELVIDRKAMVIFRDRRGKPFQYHLLDGATIKPRLQALAPYMLKMREYDVDRASSRLSQQLKDEGFDVDLTNAAWVQEINGRIYGAWTEDEMSVDVTNGSIEIDKLFYGRSVLERSLRLTGTFHNIWRYNDELFRTNTPEGVLLLFGDYDPMGLEAFRKQMLTEQSVGGNWRLPILPAGPSNEGMDGKYLKLRDTPRDALFTELLQLTAALKCAEFRAHPSIINIGATGNANSIVFGANEEYQISLAQEEGFHGLLDSLASWITQALIKPTDPELIMVWEGLDREPLEQRTDIRIKQLQYMTLNEVRATEDLPPLPSEVPTNPGDAIMSAQYEGFLNAQAASQQQQFEQDQVQQQAAMGGQPGQTAPPNGAQSGAQPPEALPPPVKG